MNLELLKEIISKHEPNLVSLFENEQYKTIDTNLGNRIIEILGDELCETGMTNKKDEITVNNRGKEIEQLIYNVVLELNL